MKKGAVRWRHKLWTEEYHNGNQIIDFKDVRWFGQSVFIFRWPTGTARMEAKTDYGGYHVWPSALEKWDDGRAVTAEERDELLLALRDLFSENDPKAKLDVHDGHDTGEFDWPRH